MNKGNSLFPDARHPEETTRKVVRCFAEEAKINDCAELAELSPRQIKNIYQRIRERMEPIYDERMTQLKATDRWKFIVEHRAKINFGLIAARHIYGIENEGELLIKMKSAPDPDKMEEVRRDLEANKEAIWSECLALSQAWIERVRSIYMQVKASQHRGVKREVAERFQKEADYRFSMWMMLRYGADFEDGSNRHSNSSGETTVSFEEAAWVRAFQQHKSEADSIEADIISVLERSPL